MILVIVGGITLVSNLTNQPNPVDGILGFDSENTGRLPAIVKEFDQVGITASASVQGLVKNSPGRVVAIEIISDATSIKYFQLFDVAKAQVPARAASLSAGFQSLKIYRASNSWASDASLAAKPLGSYQQYASPSLTFSLPIPPATASSSPTIVRIDATQLGGARNFLNGILWGVSNSYATYASASVATNPAARVKVKVLYE